VQTATRLAPEQEGNVFERLIDRQLLQAQATFPGEESLLERTRELVMPLSEAGLPLVLEHGDLSHPNLLVGRRGRVAVIDWELAVLRGLPASDLFFFLTYVAMARRGARSNQEAIVALDRAFFGQGSWARTYVRRYALELGLSRDTLTPLFIACWVKQAAGLAQRVANGGEGSRMVGGDSADGVRQNWRFAAWRHAVEQADRLDW
jgi:aminoglycoside phosphotransferase (APT) family kinase protein